MLDYPRYTRNHMVNCVSGDGEVKDWVRSMVPLGGIWVAVCAPAPVVMGGLG